METLNQKTFVACKLEQNATSAFSRKVMAAVHSIITTIFESCYVGIEILYSRN